MLIFLGLSRFCLGLASCFVSPLDLFILEYIFWTIRSTSMIEQSNINKVGWLFVSEKLRKVVTIFWKVKIMKLKMIIIFSNSFKIKQGWQLPIKGNLTIRQTNIHQYTVTAHLNQWFSSSYWKHTHTTNISRT